MTAAESAKSTLFPEDGARMALSVTKCSACDKIPLGEPIWTLVFQPSKRKESLCRECLKSKYPGIANHLGLFGHERGTPP